MGDRHLEWLTDDDLLILDGKTQDEVLQSKIDHLKNVREKGSEYAFIQKVIREGRKEGKIRFNRERAVSCEICGNRSHIETYSTGRRRGNIKYTKSKLIGGYSFADDFIVMQGSPRLGVCENCYKKIENDLRPALLQERFDYHQLIPECKYRKDAKRICFQCKKPMYESEMGKLPTIMGNGYYLGKCPNCGAKSQFFGRTHETTKEFRIIEVSEADHA